jgi:hypothetical protein
MPLLYKNENYDKAARDRFSEAIDKIIGEGLPCPFCRGNRDFLKMSKNPKRSKCFCDGRGIIRKGNKMAIMVAYDHEVKILLSNIGEFFYDCRLKEGFLEQLLIMLMTPEKRFETEDFSNFLDSSKVDWSTKIFLLRSIRNNHDYVTDEIKHVYKEYITKIQALAQERNKFAHGQLTYDMCIPSFCINYWGNNEAKKEIITDDYIQNLETLIENIDELESQIYDALPEEATKYYNPGFINVPMKVLKGK